MTKTRLDLQILLESLMNTAYHKTIAAGINTPDFSKNVWFQPGNRLIYPAIVYSRNTADTRYADDNPYVVMVQYIITVIDPNPDSLIPGLVAQLPMCKADRHFVSENLHHDVYLMYY